MFSSEKGSEVFVKIDFLLIAYGVLTDPEALRVSLEPNINESNRENDEDGEGSHEYDDSMMIIESAKFLEDNFEIH